MTATSVTGCDVPADSGDDDGPRLVASIPADGDENVDRNTAFVVTMDRLLLPRSVSRQTVRVESGDVAALLSVRFEPVSREILATSFAALPLEPDVRYRLSLMDLRDLDGRRQSEPVEIAFRTGAQEGDVYAPPTASWAEVEAIFGRACTGGGCHGVDAPALGLDLSSAEAVRHTAIGVPARQSRAGTTVEGSDGARALAGLPIVDVVGGLGRPAYSYLIYKVLGDPHALGNPMPPDAPLAEAELATISRWILTGAPTD